MADISLKFVSQKISKIRWRPTAKESLQHSQIFATGSWDDDDNKICLWKLDDSSAGDISLQDSAWAAENEPKLLCDVQHVGDVMALEFVGVEQLVSSSSTGSVSLYRYHPNSRTLSLAHQWPGLHHYPRKRCPCTCVAPRGDEMVATGGEDGRIVLLHLEHKTPVRIIEKGDSCTINDVLFMKQTEIVTVNTAGQLKLFDIRQNTDEAAKTYSVSGEDPVPLQCVAKHPGQHHIVATGGEDGMLCIWDLRQEHYPINPLQAHSATLWEVKFHPSSPDNLFTCSDDGSVWHWDGTAVNASVSMAATPSLLSATVTGAGAGGGALSSSRLSMASGAPTSGLASPWLASNISHQKLKVTELIPADSLPVNSIDIENNMLLCGSDNEAVYSVSNLVIR
ncbi:nucleoporin Nup43-like [Liolophura sinensis]|uniref:nucleoporin Nup43-like n=1 Tax=Liolophura sinensis TaxID=3198878 RepID=UPI003159561D